MKNIVKRILLLNKKEGETPLEALLNFHQKNKAYKNVKMTYAGRLDPMARGLLLVLVGEETKNKEKYLAVDKEYEFSVLFGFATDTYDILGKVIYINKKNIIKKELETAIEDNLKHFTGKFKQKYPMYSSKTVHGKPLFTYARAGKKVKTPEHEINVKSLKFFKLRKINSQNFLKNIERRIAKVKGDFRQKEILKIWRELLGRRKRNLPRSKFPFPSSFFIADFKIKCGTGTYVRGIANSLGEKLGIPALAFSIKRTKIGNWREVG